MRVSGCSDWEPKTWEIETEKDRDKNTGRDRETDCDKERHRGIKIETGSKAVT